MASSLVLKGEESVDLCKFCLKCRSKYVCPRCGTTYCSVNCYKSEAHLDCSEAFYQEWVQEELKGRNATSDSQMKIKQILNRLNNDDTEFNEELDSDDDSSLPDLSERLAGVNINDADAVWEKLSEAEKGAFENLVKTGEIANLIPNWEPWWSQRVNKSMVTVIDEKSSSDDHLKRILKICPGHCNHIKPLSELSKIKPSLSVIFDLINLLCSYALTVRYFSGNHFDFPEEASTIIHTLSKSLTSPQKFISAEMAIDAVGFQALTYNAIAVTQDNVELMKSDLKSITDGPSSNDGKYYMLSALSDMHKLFSCKDNGSKKNGKFVNTFPNADLDIVLLTRKDYKITLKRLEYFISWVLEYGDEFSK